MSEGTGTAPGIDGREGELERIIRLFNAYETPNFDRYVDPDGFCWWDAMRFILVHNLSVEQGTHGAAPVDPPKPIPARMASLARQVWAMQREFAAFLAMPRKRFTTLHIGNRVLPYMKDSLAGAPRPTLLIGNIARLDADHGITKQSVDFAIRLLTPRMKPSPEVVEAAKTIARELSGIYDTKLDLEAMILARYRMNMAGRRVWTWLLDRLPNVERIVYVNDDTLKFATFLANTRGIDTEEVQHGYMGASHGAFAYPPLGNPPRTMPDRCVIGRDTGDIVYPAPLKHVPEPTPEVDLKPLAERPYDVMVGASPKQVKETIAIVEALAPRGWKVAVRLHPAQTEAGFRAAMPEDLRDTAIIAQRLSFFEAAAQARIYVPVASYSTTGFDAADMNCKVVLLHRDGLKASKILDSVASAETDSLAALPSIVEDLLRQIGAAKAEDIAQA